MAIPLTAREQLQLAQEAGHELYVQERGPWPELGDPHPKFYVKCTCGWEGRVVRSRKALNSTMVSHLIKAVSEGVERRRGGIGA